MTKSREKYLKMLLYKLVEEQSQGEWTEEIIQDDANFFYENLWEEFKEDD